MSWLCQVVNEIQDRVLRIEQLLDFLDIRLRTAKLVGGNWEVSNQQIAQWVAGTTLPFSDSSESFGSRRQPGNQGGPLAYTRALTAPHDPDGTNQGLQLRWNLTVHFDRPLAPSGPSLEGSRY